MRDGRCVAIVHRPNNRLAMAVLNALDRRAERLADAFESLAAFEDMLDALRGPPGGAPENKGFSPPT